MRVNQTKVRPSGGFLNRRTAYSRRRLTESQRCAACAIVRSSFDSHADKALRMGRPVNGRKDKPFLCSGKADDVTNQSAIPATIQTVVRFIIRRSARLPRSMRWRGDVFIIAQALAFVTPRISSLNHCDFSAAMLKPICDSYAIGVPCAPRCWPRVV